MLVLVQDLWGQSLVVSGSLRAVSTEMCPWKLPVSILSVREQSPVLGTPARGLIAVLQPLAKGVLGCES